MRVLVITNLFPNPYQPNRAAWNRHQIRALAERHDVAVIAPILWTDEFLCRARQGRKLSRDRRSICDGLPVVHPRYVYPPKVLRASYGNCYRWSIQKMFHENVRQFCPDLVFSTWAYPDGWTAVELSRLAGVPVVVKVHGSDILQLSRYPGRYAGTIEALARADAIVAVSQDLAKQMAGLGIDEQRIHVVYNGVDADLFSPGCRADARERLAIRRDLKILLFVGNLVPVKGIDVLLEACYRLAQRDVSFQCHLVGEGPMAGKLERQARRLGITEYIKLHGAKSQAQLPDWYRVADVVVLPSYSEGVPNVLLEAAACGVPFVATRVGGIPELARSNACRLVEAGSVDELAREIEIVLAAPSARDIGGFGQRTHQMAGQELSALLNKVLQDRHSSASLPTPCVT